MRLLRLAVLAVTPTLALALALTLAAPPPCAAHDGAHGAATPAAVAAPAAAPAAVPDAPSRARDLLAALKAGDFEKAAAPFDAAVRAGLPPETLAQVWASVQAQVGALKEEGPLRSLSSEGVTTILQKLTFENAALDLRVAVTDASGEIAGLFFTPASDEGVPLESNIGIASGRQAAALPPDVRIEPAPAVPVEPASVATTLLDDLERGRFADAVSRFDATMAAGLPADKLAETWNGLKAQMGGLTARGEARSASIPEGTVVTQRLDFANGPLEMKVTVAKDGRIAGLFFVPVQSAAAPPPDDAPFTETEIAVGSGGGALPGLLALPRGEGPWPAVVLVHGSGPQDRDETIGPNRPFRDIAWGLAERGVASIRYDKRTLAHQAAMAAMQADLTLDHETVLDAVAAIRLARETPGIDPARVVLLGHSLGAMAAPRIASRAPGLAGVVFVAASAERLEDAILRQTEWIMGLDGSISEAEGAQLAALRAQVLAVKAADLSPATPASSLPMGIPARYWLDLRKLDVVSEAAALPLPMLFVQGGRDYQVTMESLQAFRRALGSRKDVRFAVFPELNHLLMTGKGRPEDYAVEGRVADEALEAIAGFVKGLAAPAAAHSAQGLAP